MVKLYYTPTSCGASSFICAFLANINFECEVVDLSTHTTESGIDFYTINPKGNVPTLVLDDGSILNENMSCLEYILDLQYTSKYDNGSPKLGPVTYTSERYILKQYLSFIATELHPILGLLFNPDVKNNDYIRNFIIKILDKKIKYLEKYMIKDNYYIFQNYFSIVDSYLYIVLSWTGYVGIDLSKYNLAYKYWKNMGEENNLKKAKKRMASIPRTII
jgi:glutathione S-transferase